MVMEDDFKKLAEEIGYKPPFKKIGEGMYEFDIGNGYAGTCGEEFKNGVENEMKKMLSNPESLNFPPEPKQPTKSDDRKAILTTEDGVVKYAGDKIYYVLPNLTYDSDYALYDGFKVHPLSKHFHSKEKAEEYIKLNNPK